MVLIVGLFAIGFLLILAEIALPGGIVGTIGFILILWGIVQSYIEFGAAIGTVVAVTAMIGTAIVFYITIRMIQSRMVLAGTQEDYSGSDESLLDLVGQTGVVQSPLRPVGIAEFGGRRVDVTAESEFIRPGERVTVVRVESNRVVVQRLT